MPEETMDQWATVELMGHAQTAGRISRPSDWGGLLRVDVPEGDGYRTEFYGLAAIYSIKLVSEDIARAYARPQHQAREYDAPIVSREQYDSALRFARSETDRVRAERNELERRLVAINALPAPAAGNDNAEDG